MKRRSLLIASALGALSLGIAVPAFAAPVGVTTASLDITDGTLDITVPTAANLGTQASRPAGGVISGALGQVQVSDGRPVPVGWVVSVISEALTPTAGGPTIAALAIGYTVGAVTPVGAVTFVTANPTHLEGVIPVLTATPTTGNSATWNPTINVAVPGNMAPGHYTGMITHSVI